MSNSEDHVTNGKLPSGYISIANALDRIIAGNSYQFRSPLKEHRKHYAWIDIRTAIIQGMLSSLIANSDGTFQIPTVEFWKAEGSKYNSLSGNDIETVSYIDDLHNRRLCVNEDEFQRRIERIVKTLPLNDMPKGLLFLARLDDDGDILPLTYMSITAAQEIFTIQRKAYSDQEINEIWMQASEELRELFYSGEIRTFHRDKSAFIRQIDPSDWGKDGTAINKVSYNRHSQNGLGIKGRLWLSYIDVLTEKGPLYGEAVVSNQELFSALGSSTGSGFISQVPPSNQEQAHSEIKDTGGRPPKYDAEAFLIEVVKIVLDGPPNQKKDLRERAQDAYQIKGLPGGRPDDEWARKRIARYWKELELR